MTVQFNPNIPDISKEAVVDRADLGAAAKLDNGIYRDALKRVFDIVLTIMALPVVLPLIAIMAFIVALDGYNPFYSQLRVGRGGRTFRMWKLRTMVQDADAILHSYLEQHPAAKQEWTEKQKLKNDPRITLVGRILRKTSLDELPQLWNVLNGTMSLVGPRPMMESQEWAYTGSSYYKLRPGITGLWQVSDRNECQFVDRVRFDDEYERTVGIVTDLEILVRTVKAVTRGTGY